MFRIICYIMVIISLSGCGYNKSTLVRLKIKDGKYNGYGVHLSGAIIDGVISRQVGLASNDSPSLTVKQGYDGHIAESKVGAK